MVNIVNIFLLQRYLFLLFHSVTSIYQQFVFTLFLSRFMVVGWKIFSVLSVLHNLCDLVLNYISTILIVFFTLVSAFLEVIGAKESYVNNSLTLVRRCEIQSWETLQSISKSRACKYQAADIPTHHNPSQSWKVTLISCKETEMRGGEEVIRLHVATESSDHTPSKEAVGHVDHWKDPKGNYVAPLCNDS